MSLEWIDWLCIGVFFLISLLIGLWSMRRAGKDAGEFFLSGRSMPWWLLGVSMVATTFSADTPNLVTDIVRSDGVAGNWTWWAYLLTGMLTVFVYARLWRRSGVFTDLEFYELRYSGGIAAFLRGFRAVYLGVIFNVLVMAAVCLAGIKIGAVLLDLAPWQTLLLTGIVTLVYSVLGGLRGILMTDFFQFAIAMIGTVWAACYIINMPAIGGLSNLVSHDAVQDYLQIIPDGSGGTDQLWTLLIIPLAVQWWASYYPGAEPGGGGYIAQRMLAAKDEKNAVLATLFFTIAHYALRPWPWILIALASLIMYPDIPSLIVEFPWIEADVIDHDLAYPAMLSHLPSGLLGIVIASLIAALMSTISTHLNWGSSYIVHDVYKRFLDPEASQRELVNLGRICTLVLMILASVAALYLKSAKQAFDIIVLMGAGTGLLFILRWFWWRINAYSELSAMVVSFIIALVLKSIDDTLLTTGQELLLSVGLTTVIWVAVTFLTRPTDRRVLEKFVTTIRPSGIGWNALKTGMVDASASASDHRLSQQLVMVFAGTVMVYGILIGTGYALYGKYLGMALCLGIAALAIIVLISQRARHFK